MTIRTIIADDEPLALERIKLLLSAYPDCQIVRECRNGKEVLEALRSQQADLLMLDVQMPGLGGLDVAREIETSRPPMIVFVTAYDSYAIQAFEVNALDYLLKPIEPARLQDAIERARERAEMEAAVDTHEKFASALAAIESLGAGEPARPMRFVVRSGSKDLLIQANDVVWIEAADYYACLHVADKRHLLRESIKKLESQLDPGKFVRIHRSAIVNIDCVREIHREGQSEGWILAANGDRIRMSPTGWKKLLAASGSR